MSERGVTARGPITASLLHDLRTPLNHIIGYSEMLVEQAEAEGQSGFVTDLQKIRSAGRQLLALLNNRVQEPRPAVPPSLPVYLEVKDVPAALPPIEPVPGASSALILVVDDNAMNREVLSRRLERQGYHIAMAEDGCEAMASVRAEAFDLVLLDIMMPQMDGYEVLREMKADEGLRHIPVIMISALDEMESVVRCIEMGADDYLPKPFDATLLKARIGASLERKRAHDREAALFAELKQSYARLQDLERLRDDLTHMIIHDLRTPLSSVISGMQTLEIMGEWDDDRREMMKIAIGGSRTLLDMINGLLDVDQMESGTMPLHYEELSAEELVSSATAQVVQLSEGKLTLIREVAVDVPRFQGDENKLRRILVNLLGNAIKFTPRGGTVTVAARASVDRQSVLFSVTDTGEGIPAEDFTHIFEKFGQVESRKAGRTMSTGLGLTFCKLAVETHGGTISVESEPGVGSKFSFTIPVTSSDVLPEKS